MSVLPNILKLLKDQIEILEIRNSIKKIKYDLAKTETRDDENFPNLEKELDP